MAKRPAKLELVFPGGPKKEKVEFGSVWPTDWDGTYNVRLTLPTGEVDERGFPVREKVTHVRTESGKKLDITKALGINLIVYEALSERPPYDGPKTSPAEFSDAEDDDIDF